MGLGEKLEKLARVVPGIAGYQDREKSRDTDKAVRMKLSSELELIKLAIEGDKKKLTENKDFPLLPALDTIASKLDKIMNLVKFASRGYRGVFDTLKADQASLERLYTFDLGLFDDIKSIKAAAGELHGSRGDSALLDSAIRKLEATVDSFEQNFSTRQNLLSTK